MAIVCQFEQGTHPRLTATGREDKKFDLFCPVCGKTETVDPRDPIMMVADCLNFGRDHAHPRPS